MAVLLGPGMVSAGFGEKNFIIIIIISIIIIIVVIVIVIFKLSNAWTFTTDPVPMPTLSRC